MVESEERYRALFENSHDALMTLELPSLRFTSGNLAAIRLLGLESEKSLLEKTPADISPEYQPDGRRSEDLIRGFFKEVMETGSCNFEWTHLRTDGELCPVTVLLTRVEIGDRTYIQSNVRDITDRIRTEQELRKSQLFLQSTFDSIQDGLSILDRDLNILHVNPTMRKWYADGRAITGRKCYECYHERKARCTVCPTVRCFQSGNSEHDIIPGAPGTGQWLELYSYPVKNTETGEIIGAVELVLDITERKQAEERLYAALADTERMNQLMQGRESRIIEMKQQVNALTNELNRPPVYRLDETPPEKSPEKSPEKPPEKPVPVACSAVSPAGPIADWGNPIENAHELVDCNLEQIDVAIAMIPLVCSAPLLLAQDRGLFAKNGLNVTLRPVLGWSAVKDLIVFGHVDVAHMLAPMPLAIREGLDGKRADIRVAAILNVNGQALALASKHRKNPIRNRYGRVYLRRAVPVFNAILPAGPLSGGKRRRPASRRPDHRGSASPNAALPGKRVWLTEYLRRNRSVKSAWRAASASFICSRQEIWDGHPCCCLAVTGEFVERKPRTYEALLRSVLEAEFRLHRASSGERRTLLTGSRVVGTFAPHEGEAAAQAFCGEFDDGLGHTAVVHDRVDYLPTPWPEHGVWMLSQAQRWRQLRRRVDYASVVADCFCADTHEAGRVPRFRGDARGSGRSATVRRREPLRLDAKSAILRLRGGKSNAGGIARSSSSPAEQRG